MEKEHFEIILEHMQSQFKVFGEGLEGLRDSLDGFKVEVRERFDRLEGRIDTLEGRLGRIEIVVRDIKRTVGLLHAIANDHETRLQKVESQLEDHLTNHS
jgi:chromosome segregation ATPase